MQTAEPQSSLLTKASFVSMLKIPTFNYATHPAVTAAIFKHHRESDFFTIDNGPDSIFDFISDMLRVENLKPDDIFFTCSPEMTTYYKKLLKNKLTPKTLEKYQTEIYASVRFTLRNWESAQKVNITQNTLPLVCDVMSTILLGTWDIDGKLNYAMKEFFGYIEARFSRKEHNPQKLAIARHYFWEIVSEAINNKKGLAGELSDQCPNNQQILLIIFSLCFAGIDSTTQSIIYTVHKFAQDKALQKELYDEIFSLQKQNDESLYTSANKSLLAQQIIMESLRMFTPVIGVTRVSKELFLKASYEGKHVTRKIPKGEHIAPSQNLAARCPMLFPQNPEKFNPKRHQFSAQLMTLPWLPFGSGKNSCPGWPVYKILVEMILAAMSQGYILSSEKEYEIEQVGSFINKLKEDVIVSISSK